MSDSDKPSRSVAAGADDLSELFAAFARSSWQERDPTATLVEIVRAAIELVPGCDEASVSVVRGRRSVTSEAASSGLATVVDALQEELQEGPCLDAAFEHVTVCVPDLAADLRWPAFSRAARDAGVGGMLAFQLYVDGDDLGALNLLSRRPGAFTEESEQVGLLFAAHASVAYASARKVERLSRGLQTQQVIGQAQGILMERHKITADRAFAFLVRASQDANVKLRELAARLVHSGDLPDPRPDSTADPAA